MENADAPLIWIKADPARSWLAKLTVQLLSISALLLNDWPFACSSRLSGCVGRSGSPGP
jgi:hypothetical protein